LKNDNLKEKEIKQEKAMGKKELESVSGGYDDGLLYYLEVYQDACKSVGNCGQDFINKTSCQHIKKNIDGEVHIYHGCTCCGLCAKACPHQAIIRIWHRWRPIGPEPY
jgi:TPP-dependent indolepyruvate ferredoxin oxidoreductase alpha subunit